MKARAWKRIAHFAGGTLAIGGAIFLGLRLRDHAEQIDLGKLSPYEWGALIGLLPVNIFMITLLAMGWRLALRAFGAPVTTSWAFSTYGITQLARYIPGNVFHFAGRQVLGMAAGIPATPLAKASGAELALVVTSGGISSLLAAPFLFTWLVPSAAATGFVIAAGCVSVLLYRFGNKAIAGAFVCYLGYMLLSGAIFIGTLLVHDAGKALTIPWTALAGSYIAAWLVGLVTPGAPAGLGVREAIILALLGGKVPSGSLLFAVLLTRVLSILADVIVFLVALGLRRTRREGQV